MKKMKGITLIALVVTIVVLLILAGVSISMLTGDSGIIKKATQSRNDANKSGAKEKIGLEVTASLGTNQKINVNDLNKNLKNIEGLTHENKTLEENPIDELPVTVELDEIEVEIKENGTVEYIEEILKVNVGETAKGNSTINGEDGSYSNPIIPKGFKAIDVGNAKWGTTDGYDYGLVIEDDTKDETTQGSQFVWVPVPDYDKFHLVEGYTKFALTNFLTATIPTQEAGASKTSIKPQLPNEGKNAVLATEESAEMYRSVKRYGGFYIARFEAGLNNTTESSELTTDSYYSIKQTQDGSVKPVSKAKVGVWNYISWGGTSSEKATDKLAGNDLDSGAVKVARSMYNNPITGTNNSATTVKSTMCYGVQRDAALVFIDPNLYTGTCESTSAMVDGTNHGNYTKVISVTGDKENYMHKNIYDLAGSMFEWSMECVSGTNRAVRGGNFKNTSNKYPASCRNSGTPDMEQSNVGFRVALYI